MRLSAGLLKFSGILMALCLVFQGTKGQRNISFRDPNLPLNQRVEALLSSLTMKEKINLLGYRNRAIPSLGIPAYNWWNEGLHGVSRAGEATVFPQAIGMAASFDDSLLHQVADAISTEARAKHNLTAGKDPGMQYFGLTFWSPNINIFRDPRWGRGQETYGEDPYLTSRMAVAFIHGIQGEDSLHLKAAACVKHFAVHSGPDALRHWFNALVDEKDLRETYLYAFHQSVQAGVASVMTAYNAVNGYPCSISPKLMGILKNDWHFSGYIVNDCGALDDIITGHHAETDPVKVAAEAIRAGIDLDCGNLLQSQVQKALDRHLLLPSEVDRSVAALLRTEFKLGFFDPPAADPYRNYGADSVDNAAHRALSLRMALESMVLLKNDGVLPLSKSKYHSMLVTGPTAASLDALLGSYHAESARMVDFVDGITRVAGPGFGLQYDLGCDNSDSVHFGGIWASTGTDVTVAVIGLSPLLEGEEGDAFLSPGAGGDRTGLELPPAQVAFIRALRKASGHPLIVVVTGGSAVDLSGILPLADAILMAWYPGEEGGTALAELLFGKENPSGRLPVTFYHSIRDLPPFTDYSMEGRTYRYFPGNPEFPFGFGLSYTSFSYGWDQVPGKRYREGDSLNFRVRVTNTGAREGDEVVQCYIKYPKLERMPIRELKQFARIRLSAGASGILKFQIPLDGLSKWDLGRKAWKLYPGTYQLIIGASSADERLKADFEVR